ncbi:MAG: hypothetical protein ACK4I8_03855 [Armatimonadota bacterium]
MPNSAEICPITRTGRGTRVAGREAGIRQFGRSAIRQNGKSVSQQMGRLVIGELVD